MKFVCLHKDGYLYAYNTMYPRDRQQFLLMLGADEIVKCFRVNPSIAPSGDMSIGMEVTSAFVLGAVMQMENTNK